MEGEKREGRRTLIYSGRRRGSFISSRNKPTPDIIKPVLLLSFLVEKNYVRFCGEKKKKKKKKTWITSSQYI